MQLEKSKIIVNSHKRDKDEAEQKLKEALESAQTQKSDIERLADERLQALQAKCVEYENTMKQYEMEYNQKADEADDLNSKLSQKEQELQ